MAPVKRHAMDPLVGTFPFSMFSRRPGSLSSENTFIKISENIMQILTSNQNSFVTFQPRNTTPALGAEFVPANPSDLVSIGNSLESQDRFDGNAFGKAVGGMFGAGIGAGAGAVGGAVISAIAGASGWGVALSTVGGLVGGGMVGAYVGSR